MRKRGHFVAFQSPSIENSSISESEGKVGEDFFDQHRTRVVEKRTLWDMRKLDEDPVADVGVSLDQIDFPRGCRRFRKSTSAGFALLDSKRMEAAKNS